MGKVFVTIVLDGVGVGHAPDAAEFGDEGSATLQHVVAEGKPRLPNLTRLGIGCTAEMSELACPQMPEAAWGTMREVSAGKDSTTGHWELAGVPLDAPFPTYPNGFPPEVLANFCERAEVTGVLGNVAASGTDIIDRHGVEHLETGLPIVYTSADSVFQVATNVDRIPLETLYEWCRIAREEVCVGKHSVGRVIARPFTGEPGAFRRLSDKRKDYALTPTSISVQERLQQGGVRTVSVGKISDLFAGVGFDETVKTKQNEEGMAATLEQLRLALDRDEPTFIWTNLVDFDQDFGHRNEVPGFAAALEAFDRWLPVLEAAIGPEARVLLTADHGNDPTYPGTDHTRELVPILLLGEEPRALGARGSFSDHAASVCAYFSIPYDGPGEAFLT